MSCRDATETLDNYLAGSLTSDESARMEQHLSNCGDCRRLAREYGEVTRLAAALPVYSPPPDAERRLRGLVAIALRETNRKLTDGSLDDTKPHLKLTDGSSDDTKPHSALQ